MIDCHVHLIALPDSSNGCYVSPRMLRRLFVRILAWIRGFDLSNPAAANFAYLDLLFRELDRSRKVKRLVLLAMDGVYDPSGGLDISKTDFLLSNDYVLQVARYAPGSFLAGVSINPQRRDALAELDRCAEQGAVLVKILPNAQCFDPFDPRYRPFYKALARHGIPLLSHTGYEFSLIGKDQSAGEPARLRTALEEGVTVIAAHACSYGLGFPEPNFKTFQEMALRYPNFYADTSALTLPNRVRTLFLLRRHPDLHDRLIFGTDYPLPVLSYPALGSGYRKIARVVSPFDRQALVLESLGIQCRDFSSLKKLN
ncbi:MAG: amidohydrolase family protein [Deltaproteobacteria bacterium]|nr:amidohydrolase family protein [Deltaproteobacteria bacterium]